MTIRNALTWARKEFKKSNVEGGAASANFLMRQVLGAPKTFILANPEKKLTLRQERKFIRYVKKRKKHEPIWYITGHIEFFGNDFLVNESVLIPRPETEILVEKILEYTRSIKKNNFKIVDIGTGSGAIILSLAANLFSDTEKKNMTSFFASDVSKKALKVARINAQKMELSKSVKFKAGDLFGPWVGHKFDIVVANLPYVPHEDMSSLAFDLVHYEPRIALDGGEKGLEIYTKFFEELPYFIDKESVVFCEIGDRQGEPVRNLVKRLLPKMQVDIIQDYAGFDRFVIIKKS